MFAFALTAQSTVGVPKDVSPASAATSAVDPKDATIAALKNIIEWHEKYEATLTEMLSAELAAKTQALQNRLSELQKQKPAVPAIPVKSKQGEK